MRHYLELTTPLDATMGGLLAEQVDLSAAILICSTGTLLGGVLAISGRLWTVPRLDSLRTSADNIV